jgi:transcriptional regulator with XRE-family HTH domain
MNTTTNTTTLGERLYRLRQQAGLTLTELAERTGVGSESISMYERGAKAPTLATLFRLAKGLGCALEVFEDVTMPRDLRSRAAAVSPEGE